MQDPLNITVPLAGVDTSIPLMPEQDYSFQVVESAIGVNSKKSGHNWDLKLALTQPVTAIDGREIKPNFPIYMSIGLQPTEDSKDPEAFRRNLGDAVDAIFGTTKDDRPDFSAQLVREAVGKNVIGSVVIDEWQGKKNNKIRRLKAQQQA